VIKYLKEVQNELKQVTWPKKEQTIKLTLTVIIISLVVGLYIGGLDWLLTEITKIIFK